MIDVMRFMMCVALFQADFRGFICSVRKDSCMYPMKWLCYTVTAQQIKIYMYLL